MIVEAVITISRFCNLRCPFCLSSSGIPDQNEVSAEKMILFLKKLPIKILKITGGEPFSPPVVNKTCKIANYATMRGIKTQINTNGTFELPPNLNVDKNLEIQVSLDGFREQHDSIRGKGVYDKALDFIITQRKKQIPIKIMRVIKPPIDEKEIKEFIDFFKYIYITPSFQVVSPVGRASDYDTITAEEFDYTVQKINELGGRCRPRKVKCNTKMPDGHRISINPDGSICPCPLLQNHAFGTIDDFNEERVRSEMETIKHITCSYPNGYCEN